MRQLEFRSADIYCQIVNDLFSSFYTRTERRGKGLAPGETERESVREMESR
jgi:hypothetical protein